MPQTLIIVTLFRKITLELLQDFLFYSATRVTRSSSADYKKGQATVEILDFIPRQSCLLL